MFFRCNYSQSHILRNVLPVILLLGELFYFFMYIKNVFIKRLLLKIHQVNFEIEIFN